MSNARNIDAYEKLVKIYTGNGGQYAAGSPNLREQNLLDLLARAQGSMKGVSDAKTSFENATNQREVVAKEVSKLASRILAELKSSGAMSQTVDDARMMLRKIKGRAASPPKSAATAGQSTEVTTSALGSHSRTNGKDYASLAYHFEKLLKTISSEPLYQPLEPELQVVGLQNTLTVLRNVNSEVAHANGALKKAFRDRNALLYTDPGSMYRTAMALKQRVKAAFGYNSEVAYDASHIRLTKPLK